MTTQAIANILNSGIELSQELLTQYSLNDGSPVVMVISRAYVKRQALSFSLIN